MSRRLKILAIGKHFDHMGQHSGYDLVLKHFGVDCDIEQIVIAKADYMMKEESLRRRMSQELGDHIRAKRIICTKEYNAVSYYTEKVMLERALEAQPDIIFYPYVEQQYGMMQIEELRVQLPDTKIVGTIHLPKSWWKVGEKPAAVRGLDLLIVMAESEISFFEKYLSGDVTFIPHGIDKSFFKPSTVNRDLKKCIFAGHWLRDIPLLVNVISHILRRTDDVTFELVYSGGDIKAHKQMLYSLAISDRVTFHSSLTDDELLSVYQSGALLLLPMYDCTANNSLLEGMACGLPVVSNDIPGIKSYVTDEVATLLPHFSPAEEMVEVVLQILSDQKVSDVRVSDNSKLIDWPVIKERHIQLFKKLID